MFLATYIISSWWCWWYGGGLGQRAFVDYYSVLALLLAFLYLIVKKNFTKWVFYSTTSFMIYYSQILTYQYRNSIIENGSEMNKQKFWFTFLKTDKRIEGLAFFNELFSGIEYANIVNIKTSQNKYLSSARDSLNLILANKDHAMLWEAFNIIFFDDNKIALRSDDGKYVSAQLNDKSKIVHIVSDFSEREKFEINILGNDSFLLKASNGNFVSLDGDTLSARSGDINSAEHFFLVKL